MFDGPGKAIPACVALLFLAAAALAASNVRRQSEAELAQIKQAIERQGRELASAAAQRDQVGAQLRTAEWALISARADLVSTQQAQASVAAQRDDLEREQAAADTRLARSRAALAAQLRSAYMLGSTDPLKLLLGQRDAALGGRLLVWHSYLGRVQAAAIDAVRQQLARLAGLDERLAGVEKQLDTLRAEHSLRLAAVEAQRQNRQAALTTLQQDTQSRSQQLARLRAQQAELERVLRELARVTPSLPAPDSSTAFGRLRGQLRWPVAGRLAARYGERRASGVSWEGVVVATERAASVRAVAAGRVVYSDWLPGLGLLAIVDHGDSYLSLYGYNDELKHAVGDQVAAGEVIAAAGDTGGRSRPELYFEIRRSGRPIDPAPWFKERSP